MASHKRKTKNVSPRTEINTSCQRYNQPYTSFYQCMTFILKRTSENQRTSLEVQTRNHTNGLWQWNMSVLLGNIYQAETVISAERTVSMNSDSLEAQNNKQHSADCVYSLVIWQAKKQRGTCLCAMNKATCWLTVEKYSSVMRRQMNFTEKNI